MKKLILLAFLVFTITLSNAQYVTIPDANFRSFLKSLYPTCFNLSNQMDTTCFEIINEELLNCNSKYINSIEGIQYFKNLKVLSCSYNTLNNTRPELPHNLVEFYCDKCQLINLSNLPESIEKLYCSYNELTILPNLPKNLKILFCQKNQLTELPTLPEGIKFLNCNYNQITSLPMLPNSIEKLCFSNNHITILQNLPDSLIDFECMANSLTNLPYLPKYLEVMYCGANRITKLPQLPQSLKYLYCNNNQLTSLPFLPSNLIELDCSNNQISSLPFLPSNLIELECWHNQISSLPFLPSNLIVLDCWHNQISSLPNLNDNLHLLGCSYNPLECLPFLPRNLSNLYLDGTKVKCLPNEVLYLDLDINLPICTNPSDICEINPFVVGLVYNDLNNNHIWDTSKEPILSKQLIGVEPNNWHGISNENGQYIVKLDTAINNTWSCTPPKYTTVNPASYSFNPDTIGLIEGDYNFGIHYIPNVNDLETAISSTVARPGFTTNIAVSVNNVGTANQSNITVKLKKPNGYNVTATSITPTAISNDTLIWQNVSIDFLQSSNFYIELQVPENAVLGTALLYEAWANGTQGDTTPLNNYATWTETVRGSYDPNDKLVSKTSLAPNYEVEKDRLIYTIRFQNTGTDTAFYVRVKDEIPDNLNISTLRVINASHDYQLIVREKNIVEFVFPNIFLPDSGTNEPKSHGFVQFAIQPKPGLPIDTKIENNAAIYFDYNAPVITNFAITEVKLITGIANNKNLDFKLFPNPTNGQLTVDLPFTGNGSWILSDISGRQIEMSNINEGIKTFNLNLNDLPNGTYFLSIQLGNQVSTAKVMKF